MAALNFDRAGSSGKVWHVPAAKIVGDVDRYSDAKDSGLGNAELNDLALITIGEVEFSAFSPSGSGLRSRSRTGTTPRPSSKGPQSSPPNRPRSTAPQLGTIRDIREDLPRDSATVDKEEQDRRNLELVSMALMSSQGYPDTSDIDKVCNPTCLKECFSECLKGCVRGAQACWRVFSSSAVLPPQAPVEVVVVRYPHSMMLL